MVKDKITVLGAGSWGTVFAKVLADGDHEVLLWTRRKQQAREITETHRNSDYLENVNLPKRISATSSLREAVGGASYVFVSVPSQSLRELLLQVKPHLSRGVVVISLMKGVEKGTGLRMSEVIAETLGIVADNIAVISGPNLALEIVNKQPTASVVSSMSLVTAQRVASLVRNSYFQSFVNTDVIGTEFGGVLKNLIAVAIGIADGAGYGENTKASVLTRGLAELTDFAVAYGAEPATMSGLAGLGDLVATSWSPLSRNNTAGRLLGQGYCYLEVIETMNQTAEGLASVEPILELARARGVEMPIVDQVRQVLTGQLNPKDLAPQIASDGVPRGERADYEKTSGSSLRRAIKRTFDKLRHCRWNFRGD